MSASDYLPPEVVDALTAEYGSPEDALLLLLGDELDALGAVDVTGMQPPDKPPELFIPPRRERYIWRRVAKKAGHGDLLNGDRPHVEATEQTRPEPDMPLPPVPTQALDYTYGTLQKAVKAFANDETPGDVAREAILTPPDARRVRLLREQGLFRLNDKGKLVVDSRVTRRGKKYVLRYLSADGTRWLDPNRELRG